MWGDPANPDADGANNLSEYALGGTSPTDATAQPQVTGGFFTDSGNGLTYLRCEFHIREGTTGFTVSPQASSDLNGWQNLVPMSMTSEGDGTAFVIAHDPVPISTTPGVRRFLRVLVSTAP